MFKDKKIRVILIIGITLISILELYSAYNVLIEYRGIYQIGIFMPFIFQPFIYKALLKKIEFQNKLKTLIVVLISVLLPLTIYATLPKYTYDEGKQFVEQDLKQSEKVIFIDNSFSTDTIPVTNNPQQLFVRDRNYYYIVSAEEGIKYFTVNPLTGKIGQIANGYW